MFVTFKLTNQINFVPQFKRIFKNEPKFVNAEVVGFRYDTVEKIDLVNRFHVAVRLFSKRSQMTSKCCKNKIVAHETTGKCVTHVLTKFFYVLCNLLLDRRMATWNMFYITKKPKNVNDVI